MRPCFLILSIPSLLVLAVGAFTADLSWGGYLRDDVTIIDRHLPAMTDDYLGNYLRLRLDVRAYLDEHASLTATPEFVYLSGERLFDRYTGQPLGIDHEVGLNRAQVDLSWERLQITLGKQRLQLSNSAFFSSLDVFNPADYTEPKSERAGVTSTRMTAYWSGFSGERLVFVPKGTWENSPKAARTFMKVGDMEMGVTYLEPASSYIKTVGLDLTGPIDQIGIYMEVACDVDSPAHKLFPRGTLGINWGWRGGPNITLEYYHDERGATSKSAYDYKGYSRGLHPTLGRDLVGEALTFQVHPLWTLGLASLVNVNDNSYYVNPSITWNLLDNVDLKLESDHFDGVTLSEFYFQNTIYRLQMMAWF